MDHELYVLKRIPVDAASPSEADAAVREAHVLSLLRHPHVVPYKVSSCSCKDAHAAAQPQNEFRHEPSIFAGLIASPAQEFFKFDGDLCLVMAHCEGGDLFAHAKALRWVLQAS